MIVPAQSATADPPVQPWHGAPDCDVRPHCLKTFIEVNLFDKNPVMPKLSSITITCNEAANIADCMDSLSFCDERVVVDGGSKDDTVAIAEKHGATVYHHPWTDHGTQKNSAIARDRRLDFAARCR